MVVMQLWASVYLCVFVYSSVFVWDSSGGDAIVGQCVFVYIFVYLCICVFIYICVGF